jgi:hypothetical protein
LLPEIIEKAMKDHMNENMPPGFDASNMNMEMMQKLEPFM